MQFQSIPQLKPMLKRLHLVARLPLRAYRSFRRKRGLRTVERAMHRAWPETKSKIELPAERAAYYNARRELDVWAWTNDVPFEPFSPYKSESFDEDGEGDALVVCA